jgi:hypothetical protein
MKLETLIHLPNVMTGVWRRFGVHAFEGHITTDDMTRMQIAGDGWMRRNPGSMVELVIIFPSDARMSGDERARLAAMIKRSEAARAAAATVVLASGLMGSMHRSVLTGLQMLAPPRHPSKVFGGLPDAVQWLSPHVQQLCGPEATGPALLGAVEAMCATFKVHRSEHPPA